MEGGGEQFSNQRFTPLEGENKEAEKDNQREGSFSSFRYFATSILSFQSFLAQLSPCHCLFLGFLHASLLGGVTYPIYLCRWFIYFLCSHAILLTLQSLQILQHLQSSHSFHMVYLLTCSPFSHLVLGFLQASCTPSVPDRLMCSPCTPMFFITAFLLWTFDSKFTRLWLSWSPVPYQIGLEIGLII